MDKMRLHYLLERRDDNTISEDEIRELDDWYDTLSYVTEGINEADSERLKMEMLGEFRQKFATTGEQGRVRKINIRWLKIAALVAGLLFGGIVTYMVYQRNISEEFEGMVNAPNTNKDLPPGTDRATLTLGDGTMILLEERDSGMLAQQGKVQIVKLADGTLDYRKVGSIDADAEILYNTISTPRGGEYKLTLPDGSNVWLNASSSLTYPTVFAGNERRVEVTGEVYFEVAENRQMPFIVSINGRQKVQVIGTHFNIYAYRDEGPEKITLLEGSVSVAEKSYSVILKPGQQSWLTQNGFTVEEADVDQVIAWKSGFFEFENSSLQTIMRGISRWYDIDVRYIGKPKTEMVFGGRINRHLPLSNVLKILEAYGVDAKINGKEILISE